MGAQCIGTGQHFNRCTMDNKNTSITKHKYIIASMNNISNFDNNRQNNCIYKVSCWIKSD
jgi:hypothetical protein